MYYTHTTDTSCSSSYDSCTILSLRRDNSDLYNRSQNLQRDNNRLREELTLLRNKYEKQSDYVRELRKDARKANRLKVALKDFIEPVESPAARKARKTSTYMYLYGGSSRPCQLAQWAIR